MGFSDTLGDGDNAFDPVTADVDALVKEAELRGYHKGAQEMLQERNEELRREAIGDVIERLRAENEELYRAAILRIVEMLGEK